MKQCGVCKEDLSLDNFWIRRRKNSKGEIKVSYQDRCKSCSSKRRKEYYLDNREQEKAKRKFRETQVKSWYLDYKSKLICKSCGDNRHYVLDFHHKENFKKEATISRMVDDAVSISKIKQEIQKCEVLCANCHREHHYFERNKK